tara:strand:- start:86 stop:991 length:906 start_codon:yes stop_codon:yes gene_type:complete
LIKLKDLLLELDGTVWIDDQSYPAHTKSALDWIRMGDHIPLTPKIVQSVLGKKIPVKSFHITSPDSLQRMKGVIGKKKSISTFTKSHEEEKTSKGRGIQTGTGGIIFYVEGNLLSQRSMDFDTVPDKQGRRWVESHYLFGDRQTWKIIQKKAKLDFTSIQNKMSDIEKGYHDLWVNAEDIDYEEYKALVKKEQGPLIAKMIKQYIDMANKAIKGYKTQLMKNLIYPKKIPGPWWNEILVYDTKIIDVFILDRLVKTEYEKNMITRKMKDIGVPESKWTIGKPAQYRKWFQKRDGEIERRMK